MLVRKEEEEEEVKEEKDIYMYVYVCCAYCMHMKIVLQFVYTCMYMRIAQICHIKISFEANAHTHSLSRGHSVIVQYHVYSGIVS